MSGSGGGKGFRSSGMGSVAVGSEVVDMVARRCRIDRLRSLRSDRWGEERRRMMRGGALKLEVKVRR